MRNYPKASVMTASALLTLVSTVLLWEHPVFLVIALSALAAVQISFSPKTYGLLFVIAGVLGVAAEIVAVWAGAWTYTTPHLLGVPVWLFLLRGHAALFLAGLYEWLS